MYYITKIKRVANYVTVQRDTNGKSYMKKKMFLSVNFKINLRECDAGALLQINNHEKRKFFGMPTKRRYFDDTISDLMVKRKLC